MLSYRISKYALNLINNTATVNKFQNCRKLALQWEKIELWFWAGLVIIKTIAVSISQINISSVSSLDFSVESQICLSNCLLKISTWMSNRHLTLNTSIFKFSPPSYFLSNSPFRKPSLTIISTASGKNSAIRPAIFKARGPGLCRGKIRGVRSILWADRIHLSWASQVSKTWMQRWPFPVSGLGGQAYLMLLAWLPDAWVLWQTGAQTLLVRAEI